MKNTTSRSYVKDEEKSLRIRRAIVYIVRRSESPVTYSQLGRALDEDHRSIMNYCYSLLKEGWIKEGPLVRSTSKDRQWIKSLVAGENQAPIRNPVQLRTPEPKKGCHSDLAITDEDLAWMQKYQEQRAQRYRRRGLEVPCIY